MDAILSILAAFDGPVVALAILMLFGMWVAVQAQVLGIVDWSDGLRDPDSKVSFMRLAVLVSLITSTWVLVDLTLDAVKNKDDLDALFNWYLLYLIVWSGAPTVGKLIEFANARWGSPAAGSAKTPQ